MADYLIQDTTLTAIGDAIRAKTGTSDPIPVPDIPAKIAEAGVVVQRISGTFTTNSKGSATVNCGFRPDLFIVDEGHNGGDWAHTAAFPFYEIQRKETINVPLWGDTDLDIYATINGFAVSIQVDDFYENAIKNTTFNYIAVKYT